jgi:hypothetical protein
VHDGDAVAELLRLFQVVGREEDGHPPSRPQAGDVVEELEADARVQADGRLVEEQHLGIRDQRPGDLEAAALAPAVGVDRTVDERAELERVDDLVDAPYCGGRLQAPEAGVHGQVAATRERAVDHRVLEHHGADPACRHGSVATSKPASRARPAVGAMVVVSMPTVVDLPAPFGPSSPNTSPWATSKVRPFTASTPRGRSWSGCGSRSRKRMWRWWGRHDRRTPGATGCDVADVTVPAVSHRVP